ncbi:hypothetical protein B0I08_104276 [Glaciihabitans tibetensis]|uniref:DUF4352 domain-containing protein n=1 Tax=Glaciihabitans tibetensis TaxID=1266600 RepID=A0A2T0VEE8_9MICO|nr:hypothetical protein [Glaciihabitans tibetensis]PRY68573.1 hypothetical protein B0I08_104276 [Glaciihabitans tibetensis]
MKRWLRRNFLGLIAIVLLVPATVAITFANELGSYDRSRATEAISVAAADPADYAGTGWQLTDVRRIPWGSDEGADAGIPRGTDLVLVTVEVTPDRLDADGLPPLCIVRLDEMDGTSVQRSWANASSDLSDYRASEGVESYCTRETVDPYLLESIFLVPSDASDELAMGVQVEQELPRYLSLRL